MMAPQFKNLDVISNSYMQISLYKYQGKSLIAIKYIGTVGSS